MGNFGLRIADFGIRAAEMRGSTRMRGDGETLERQLREAQPRAVLFLGWVGAAERVKDWDLRFEISDLRSQIGIG